jgi:hypothetical protein
MYERLVGILACLMPVATLADAQLTMLDKSDRVDATYRVKDGKVRVESADAGDVSMLYDAATHGFTVLDHGEKRYMRVDAQTAAAAGAAASDAMKAVEERLAALPPEQREALKKMMPKIEGAEATVPVVKADRTGQTDTVAGTACDLVQVTMDGKALGEACIAAKGVGLSDGDQQTLRAMFDDMSRMASSVLGRGARSGQQFAALGGVPLRWREADTGRVTTTRIDASAGLDATVFEIPAGYAERRLEIPGAE